MVNPNTSDPNGSLPMTPSGRVPGPRIPQPGTAQARALPPREALDSMRNPVRTPGTHAGFLQSTMNDHQPTRNMVDDMDEIFADDSPASIPQSQDAGHESPAMPRENIPSTPVRAAMPGPTSNGDGVNNPSSSGPDPMDEAKEDEELDVTATMDEMDEEQKLAEELKRKVGVSRRSQRMAHYKNQNLDEVRKAERAATELFRDDDDPVARIKQFTRSQEESILGVDEPMGDDEPVDDTPAAEVLQEAGVMTMDEANAILGLSVPMVNNPESPGMVDGVPAEVDEAIGVLTRGVRTDESDKIAMEEITRRVNEDVAHDSMGHHDSESVVEHDSGDDGEDGEPVYSVDSSMTIIEDRPGGLKLDSRSSVEEMLEEAVKLGASDIHMASDRPIKLRINGSLYSWSRYEVLSPKVLNQLASGEEMKLLSHEMVGRLNQQKSVDLAYTLPDVFGGERFRMHVMDTSGEIPGFVLRRIDPVIRTPEESMLDPGILAWGDLAQGLVLVTGPTGSGKSSLLATILREVQKTQAKKIITLEEPIETVYPVDGLADIVQREVPDNCPTFARGIRDAMREDPDIILVGEIRDFDTISAALQACNTGHLTFATIHANSAPDVITRIMDLAGEGANKNQLRSDLARNLKGVVSQRLLLKADGKGRIPVRETIYVGPGQKRQIMDNDVDGMMLDLKRQGLDLDSRMIELMLAGRTTLKSARNASTERQTFDSRLAVIPREFLKRVVLDVDHSMDDDELEYQPEGVDVPDWYTDLLA